MLDYENLLSLEPFSCSKEEKDTLYKKWLSELGAYHVEHCQPYTQLTKALGVNAALPVKLFKEFDLRSVGNDSVMKTMTSSGTTGQSVSKVYLDRDTSARQSKVLAKIVGAFIGKNRCPMLIIDTPSVIKNRAMFSARGAGILGFSMLGRNCVYALDDNMNLDFEAIESFCEKHKDEEVLLFGFTFMVWQYFCEALKKEGRQLKLQGSLIHGGGWKKLADQAVDNQVFKQTVQEVCGISRVYNYYGMVEQTGSIFMECECGHLHASIFSDIDILDPLSLAPQDKGRGVIQSTSLLPTSYPGHILLTEDEGEILGEDDCPCGRNGKYFAVYGRLKGAEIRGCSDTYERN